MTEIESTKSIEKSSLPSGKLFFTLILSVACLLGLLMTTSPIGGGPRIVLVFLTLVFAVALQAAALFAQVALSLLDSGVPLKRVVLFSVLSGFSIVFLVGLATLNQVSLVDFVLVVSLQALVMFYLNRRF